VTLGAWPGRRRCRRGFLALHRLQLPHVTDGHAAAEPPPSTVPDRRRNDVEPILPEARVVRQGQASSRPHDTQFDWLVQPEDVPEGLFELADR
jgi:hypothetical protein